MKFLRTCPSCGRALLVAENATREQLHAEDFCIVPAHYMAAGFGLDDMHREVGAINERVRARTAATEAALQATEGERQAGRDALQQRIGALEGEEAALRQKLDEALNRLLDMGQDPKMSA